MTLTIAIANETTGAERRVALTPDATQRLLKKYPSLTVVVEESAGEAAGYPDAQYKASGAKLAASKAFAKTEADLHFRVTPPTPKAVLPLAKTGTLVTLTAGPDTYKSLGAHNVLALEKLPRTSRAQAADVLSSQANLAGYAAVLAAANVMPRLMPMLMTAAGSSRPAQVLVLGVGVAGLQAIATAKRLGAQVHAFDVRPEVKEQIQSLGAKPVAIEAPKTESKGGYAGALKADDQKHLQDQLAKVIAGMDIVISTAQIPGKPAPVLITEAAVKGMKPATVIVDLGAAGYNKANGVKGGNCPLTVADKTTVTANNVTLIGDTNFTSKLAGDASRFWAQNMVNLAGLLIKNDALDFSDDLIAAMRVVKEGKAV